MGVPSEKFENAVHCALSDIEYALDHVATFDDIDLGAGVSVGGLYRGDLFQARDALRRIVTHREERGA